MAKRGQAALEFLATYGWAFIVILIVIGALAYFGVTAPQRLLPDRCNLGAEFNCINYQVDTGAGEFNIRFSSNTGPVVVTDVAATSSEGDVGCTYGGGNVLLANNATDVTLSCSTFSNAGIISGEKAKLDVAISYRDAKDASGTYAKTVKGDVVTTAQ